MFFHDPSRGYIFIHTLMCSLYSLLFLYRRQNFLHFTYSLIAISGPKKGLDIQGSPLPVALEMDLPASKSLRPPYKKQVP